MPRYKPCLCFILQALRKKGRKVEAGVHEVKKMVLPDEKVHEMTKAEAQVTMETGKGGTAATH